MVRMRSPVQFRLVAPGFFVNLMMIHDVFIFLCEKLSAFVGQFSMHVVHLIQSKLCICPSSLFLYGASPIGQTRLQ